MTASRAPRRRNTQQMRQQPEPAPAPETPELPSWETPETPETPPPAAAAEPAPPPAASSEPSAAAAAGDTQTAPASADTQPEAAAATETPSEEPKRPSWEDQVVALAGQLANPRFPAPDLARLRRLNPEQPHEPLFWSLLAQIDPPPTGAFAEAKWAAVIQGIALMTPNQGRGRPQPPAGWWPSAHTPETPAGTALCRGGDPRPGNPRPYYAEARLELLLAAEGSRLRELYIQACRQLGQAGQPANCRQLARLLFSDGVDPRAGQRLRQNLARDYYRGLRRRLRPAGTSPGAKDANDASAAAPAAPAE